MVSRTEIIPCLLERDISRDWPHLAEMLSLLKAFQLFSGEINLFYFILFFFSLTSKAWQTELLPGDNYHRFSYGKQILNRDNKVLILVLTKGLVSFSLTWTIKITNLSLLLPVASLVPCVSIWSIFIITIGKIPYLMQRFNKRKLLLLSFLSGLTFLHKCIILKLCFLLTLNK